jgi:glycosyltransferase involved in cell wall biosynthesis
MKLGVVIPTYRRLDNRTPSLLKRALDSVFKQTYQDFKIFLIGDKYDREQEVKEILSKYPLEKIYFENLPYAAERDKYHNKWVIWSYGGVNATNHGIDVALNENYEFICHLDHDDYWDDCHLEEISKSIITTNSDWICTKAKYINELVYPSIECSDFYCEFLPKPERLIHSSVCMNFKKIPLKYRDIYKETGKIGLPSDADLWVRVSDYCKNNNIKTTLINKITCYHTEEGYERK